MPELLKYHYQSPLAFLEIGASDTCLLYISLHPTDNRRKSYKNALIKETVRQLDEYFRGVRTSFLLPLSFDGYSTFQKTVWNALSEIPYGETKSYQEIARISGKPQAARAVGNACGQNPYLIVIPCHRVIKSDGSLGGFSGGIEHKRKLLDHELAILHKD